MFVSNKEDTEVGGAGTATSSSSVSTSIAEERDGAEEASPQDPDYISQIKRVSKACKPRTNLMSLIMFVFRVWVWTYPFEPCLLMGQEICVLLFSIGVGAPQKEQGYDL